MKSPFLAALAAIEPYQALATYAAIEPKRSVFEECQKKVGQ